MKNGILSMLPAVHSTILSIAVALCTVIFINAHQEIFRSQTKLSNVSRQISNIIYGHKIQLDLAIFSGLLSDRTT
jgi:hypothetical protein